MMDRAPTYVRLFNLLSAIREASPFSEMNAEEERLLGELILRWHRADPITVSAVMSDATHASSSAIYRRLISLRDKGLVNLRVDESDRRVRFVEPTKKANDYIHQLSLSLDAAFPNASKA